MNEDKKNSSERRTALKKSLVFGASTVGLMAAISKKADAAINAAIVCTDSISDLTNLSSVSDGTIAYTRGFAQKNDGGGGFFYFDINSNISTFNSTSTDGMIAVPADGNGRWIRQWDGGYLNIRWFGALPNGPDCSNALNTAIYYAEKPADPELSISNPGKTIFIPTGRYYFNQEVSDIKKGVSIIGEGSTGSTDTVGTTLYVNYANSDDNHGFIRYIGYQTFNTGGSLRNLTIQALSNSFLANLVTLQSDSNNPAYVSHWTAENVRFSCNTKAKRALFLRDFEANSKWRVRDINIINCYLAGATQDYSTIVLSNVANAFISNCFVYQAGAAATPGIWITGEDSSTNINISGGAIPTIRLVNIQDSLIAYKYQAIDTTGGTIVNTNKVLVGSV